MNADKIVIEIYRRMYKEAEPSADFDKLVESGETGKSDWYEKYYLDNKRQDEIIDEVCDRYKVSERYKFSIAVAVHFGCAPCCAK